MPKCGAHKPHEGQHPNRISSIALVNRRRGKANLPAEKPLRGSIVRHNTNHAKSGSGRPVKTGVGAGRGKSLERPNPGEQRIVCGFYRRRSTDSQREQGPEAETNASYRDLIVGLYIHKRQVGNGPWLTDRLRHGTALVPNATASRDQVRGKSFEG
jgi:hypothetical protein